MNDKKRRIAELNDFFRKSVLNPVYDERLGQIYITNGIFSLPPEDQIVITAKVYDFNEFTQFNNPNGEHDFGIFDHNGEKIYWKIDYFDPTMRFESEDPSDPDKTVRVLTIMLACEY